MGKIYDLDIFSNSFGDIFAVQYEIRIKSSLFSLVRDLVSVDYLDRPLESGFEEFVHGGGFDKRFGGLILVLENKLVEQYLIIFNNYDLAEYYVKYLEKEINNGSS